MAQKSTKKKKRSPSSLPSSRTLSSPCKCSHRFFPTHRNYSLETAWPWDFSRSTFALHLSLFWTYQLYGISATKVLNYHYLAVVKSVSSYFWDWSPTKETVSVHGKVAQITSATFDALPDPEVAILGAFNLRAKRSRGDCYAPKDM